MLNLISVQNIGFEVIENTSFDVGIFASGFESRSSYLAKSLTKENIKNVIVLGFAEFCDDRVRQANDKFYSKEYLPTIVVSSQNESEIYSQLITNFDRLRKNIDKRDIKILIDYTSMSRMWYSGILNFLRLQTDFVIEVYLNYSLGEYDEKLLDYSYSSINSIPFHEGALSSNSRTLLVLGIGFSPYLIKSVIEEIEPNDIIGILPIPNVVSKYQLISEAIREDILTQDIDQWVKCPIDNLETIFRTYAEITNNNFSSKDILFLSLGPKIFTLASILVGQRFKEVTCLYLRSSIKKSDVKPTGDFICNKVCYK